MIQSLGSDYYCPPTSFTYSHPPKPPLPSSCVITIRHFCSFKPIRIHCWHDMNPGVIEQPGNNWVMSIAGHQEVNQMEQDFSPNSLYKEAQILSLLWKKKGGWKKRRLTTSHLQVFLSGLNRHTIAFWSTRFCSMLSPKYI